MPSATQLLDDLFGLNIELNRNPFSRGNFKLTLQDLSQKHARDCQSGDEFLEITNILVNAFFTSHDGSYPSDEILSIAADFFTSGFLFPVALRDAIDGVDIESIAKLTPEDELKTVPFVKNCPEDTRLDLLQRFIKCYVGVSKQNSSFSPFDEDKLAALHERILKSLRKLITLCIRCYFVGHFFENSNRQQQEQANFSMQHFSIVFLQNLSTLTASVSEPSKDLIVILCDFLELAAEKNDENARLAVFHSAAKSKSPFAGTERHFVKTLLESLGKAFMFYLTQANHQRHKKASDVLQYYVAGERCLRAYEHLVKLSIVIPKALRKDSVEEEKFRRDDATSHEAEHVQLFVQMAHWSMQCFSMFANELIFMNGSATESTTAALSNLVKTPLFLAKESLFASVIQYVTTSMESFSCGEINSIVEMLLQGFVQILARFLSWAFPCFKDQMINNIRATAPLIVYRYIISNKIIIAILNFFTRFTEDDAISDERENFVIQTFASNSETLINLFHLDFDIPELIEYNLLATNNTDTVAKAAFRFLTACTKIKLRDHITHCFVASFEPVTASLSDREKLKHHTSQAAPLNAWRDVQAALQWTLLLCQTCLNENQTQANQHECARISAQVKSKILPLLYSEILSNEFAMPLCKVTVLKILSCVFDKNVNRDDNNKSFAQIVLEDQNSLSLLVNSLLDFLYALPTNPGAWRFIVCKDAVSVLYDIFEMKNNNNNTHDACAQNLKSICKSESVFQKLEKFEVCYNKYSSTLLLSREEVLKKMVDEAAFQN